MLSHKQTKYNVCIIFGLIHISCPTTALAFGKSLRYRKHPVFAESPFMKYIHI